MRLVKLLTALMLITVIALSTKAQHITSSTDQSTPSALTTGTPPLGSFGGSGFDKVNLYNGNVNFSIPVGSLGGRNGLGMTLVLSYNSKVWRVENDIGANRYGIPVYFNNFTAGPNLGPGWSLNVGNMVKRQTGWVKNPTTLVTLTTFTFTAPDGTQYDFRDDLTNGEPLSTPYNNQPTLDGPSRGFLFHTSDGSAATFINKTDNLNQDLPVRDFYRNTGVGPTFPSGIVILRNGTRFKIVKGDVVEQQDSNGNIVKFIYNSHQLKQIIDTLGRTIDINFSNSKNSPIIATITSKGIGGQPRVIEIKRKKLGDAGALVSGGIKTLSELYPDLSTTGGGPRPIETLFNPSVLTEISLPDNTTGNGHKWQFQYNEYGEVARVVTPSNGAITYTHVRSTVAPDPEVNRIGPEIFRRVMERKVFDNKNSTTEKGKTTYSDPTILDTGGFPAVTETSFDNTGKRLSVTIHRYLVPATANFGANVGILQNTGYRTWIEGKEVQTEEVELNAQGQNTGRRRITEYEYEQRANVAWIPNANFNFLNQPENDPRLAKVTTRLESGQVSVTEYTYDRYNNVTSELTRAFNGDVLRRTQRTYLTTNPFQSNLDYQTNLSIHQRSLLLREDVIGINPVNNLEITESTARFEYDNYSNLPLIDRSFSPSNGSRNPSFGTSYQTRGNVTKIVRGIGSDESIISTQYDITGNVIKTFGPLTTQEVATEYDPTHFAFPIKTTQVVQGAPQPFVLERTYDFSTGAILTSSGLNKVAGETTSYFYNDLLDRLTKVVRPTGAGETTYTYSPASSFPSTVNVSSKLDATTDLFSTTFYDGLLNPIKSIRQDPRGDVTSETTYDGLGRVIKVINPQRGNAEDGDTRGYTETTYDGFGRVLIVETFSANGTSTGKVFSSYNGSDIEVTDQAGKKRKSVSDALGRLISVFEPDANGSFSLETKYSYDARGNLLKVQQGTQTRTFVYDSLGRLTSANAPESGLTTYSYDAASNLLTRTDARNITTSFIYDSLNRTKSKNHSDSTPDVFYFYDSLPSTLPSGVSLPSGYQTGVALGRLVATATASTPEQQATATFYTYDLLGRITNNTQRLDNQNYSSSSTYNLASLPTSLTYPSGRVVTHAYNNAGQLTDVMSNNSPISQNALYTPSGAIESHKLGNNLFHKVSYNSRLQPTKITLGSASSGLASEDKWKQEYNYGTYSLPAIQNTTSTPSVSTDPSQNNGNIGSIKLTPGAGKSPMEQFFVYDELNRLKLAKEFAKSPNIISTFAGSGRPEGYNGDNILATTAKLALPSQVTVLNSEVFISELNNARLRKVDTQGIITTIAGGGTILSNLSNDGLLATSYRYSSVDNVATFAGEIYYTPSLRDGNIVLAKLTSDGRQQIIADVTALGVTQGLAFDQQGNAYISGAFHSVYKITGSSISVFAGTPNQRGYSGDGGDALSAKLNFPASLTISNNSLYIVELFNHIVRKVDLSTNIISTFAGNGTSGFSGDEGQATLAQLSFPTGVTADPQGNVYILDGNNYRVRKVNSQGIISTFAGNGQFGDGGDGGDALFGNVVAGYENASPFFDGSSLYFPNDFYHKIKKVTLSASPNASSWSQLYSYDRYGNRLSVDGTNPQSLNISDSNNRITTSGYTYDAVGNLKSDPSGSTPKFYFYDADNRLIKVSSDSSGSSIIAQYFYDGDGKRIKKVVVSPTPSTTRFVYSAGGTLLAEYEGEPSPTPSVPSKENIYAPSGLLAVVEGNLTSYLTPDHLGSPRVITDATGSVLSRRDFFPFGESIDDPNIGNRSSIPGYSPSPDSIRQKFTGYERDDESGLDFAQARYLTSKLGRFISVDPLAGNVYDPQTLNRYAYVLNNPLNLIDPFGTNAQDPVNAALGQRLGQNAENYNAVASGVNFYTSLLFAPLAPLAGELAQLPIVKLEGPTRYDPETGEAIYDGGEVAVKGNDTPPILGPGLETDFETQMMIGGGISSLIRIGTGLSIIDDLFGPTGGGGSSTPTNPIEKALSYELVETHGLTKSKTAFRKLVDDVRQNGVKEPIKYVEHEGKKYIVDGHHRAAAAQKLGIREVPVQKVELPFRGYQTLKDLEWSER